MINVSKSSSIAQVVQSTLARTQLTSEEVEALSAGLQDSAKALMTTYAAAPDSSAKFRVLIADQGLNDTIEKFVTDVENGAVTLPAGTRALDVVSPAVAEFLKAGVSYSVHVRAEFGGSVFQADHLGDDGLPQWFEQALR